MPIKHVELPLEQGTSYMAKTTTAEPLIGDVYLKEKNEEEEEEEEKKKKKRTLLFWGTESLSINYYLYVTFCVLVG